MAIFKFRGIGEGGCRSSHKYASWDTHRGAIGSKVTLPNLHSLFEGSPLKGRKDRVLSLQPFPNQPGIRHFTRPYFQRTRNSRILSSCHMLVTDYVPLLSILTGSDSENDLILLQGMRSNIYVEGVSWDRNDSSTSSRQPEAGPFQLRPNDIFHIEQMQFSIQLG